jgi:uncharacterized protein
MSDLRNREFLGQGLAFPLQFSPRGQISLAKGENDIEQAIRIILGTVPGERVMRPEFGCQAWELVFAPNDPETAGLMADYVGSALERWEPRIEVNDVLVYGEEEIDGALVVEVLYTIKSTHDQRSLVYPFYIANEEAG